MITLEKTNNSCGSCHSAINNYKVTITLGTGEYTNSEAFTLCDSCLDELQELTERRQK